ncbi:MAG: DUF1254 domain-containing protein [Caulobacter sp.]|nr:DUF1254 domain-containing protein [Caulobacter sp.]
MSDLRTAAREAWLYALPLIEIAAVRSVGLLVGTQPNTFGMMRKLADHRARAVTTPNNDTLYATAQLDLSNGPVTLTVPPSGDRYVSLQLMDAYSNSFCLLGTRTTGNGGGVYTLVGPEAAAEGRNVVRSPTRHVWALARILVEGPHDFEAAQKVQTGFSAQGPEVPPFGQYARRGDSWQDYFAAADALMALNPPPVTDRALLEKIAPLGLGEGRFDASRFSEAEQAEIADGVQAAKASVRGGGGLSGNTFIEGWAYPASNLGDFRQDYDFRAVVALGGLAALPLVEATYLRAGAPGGGGAFDGLKTWRLHIPADRAIPVNSFWSLSMYEITPERQFFFTDNPLGRYAIGDRTPGLKWNDDGSLDLWMGHENPGPDRESNWLPAPAGPFALFMRGYLPKPELLDGRYRLPPVVEV